MRLALVGSGRRAHRHHPHVGDLPLLERQHVDRDLRGDGRGGGGHGVPAGGHAIRSEHDARGRVRRHLGERASDGDGEVGPIAADGHPLRCGQARLGTRWVLGGGVGPEGDGADGVVFAHADLGDRQLLGDALVGVGHQIDGATAIDGNEHGEAIERTPDLRTGRRPWPRRTRPAA
jgi:hypothetical protein